MSEYRKRIADTLLEERLEAMGAVLIEGPKACGKTTTAEQLARSVLYMDDPTSIGQNLQLAQTNVKRLLQGNTPRLIDEWPMSLQKKSRKAALRQATEYFEAIIHSDISRVDGIARNEFRAKRLMRSYARLQGAMASVPTIVEDMKSNEPEVMSDETVTSYIKALKKIFVIEDMPAWNPNLRSKTAIRTGETRYFVDPSLAVAALGIGPNDLLNDLETMGLFFETLCVRDLRVFADVLDGEVYHYRDKSGLECDTVVHLRNGSYGLIEIKLGGEKLIDDGVKALTALSEKIDTEKMKAPAFKMVLTAVGRFAYRRQDGIYVVPAGCLKD